MLESETQDKAPGEICYPAKSGWLDRPFLDTTSLTREKALYGLVIALAILSRLWNLGQHVLSHDETIHAQWPWHLYQGLGYQHTPLSHGPFLFHATALSYYVFGDNDFSARLVPALMGIVLVVLPYTLRRWLGRSGALVASFLFLISPSLLYYSRYARHDIPVIVWALITVLAIFRYLDEEQEPGPAGGNSRWLMVLAASLSLMFATKEVSFIYIAIFGLFLMLLFFSRLGTPHRQTLVGEQWRKILLTILGLAVVIVLALSLLLISFSLVELFPLRYRDCGQAPVPSASPGELQCAEGGCKLIQGHCQRPIPIVTSDSVVEFDQMGVRVAIRLTWFDMILTAVLIGVITVLTGIGVYIVLDRLMPFRSGEHPVLDLILFIGSFTLPFLATIAINGSSRVVSRLLFGIGAAFNSLDYSEAGLLRSTGFVFVLLAVSVAVGLWWDRRRWLPAAGVFYGIFVVLFTTVFTNGNGLASGMVGSLGYWLEQQAVERGGQPFYYYGLMVSLYEYLPLVGFIAAVFYALTRKKSPPLPNEPQTHSLSTVRCLPSTFILFLFFWTALTWFAYTIAGEKMPWMTVHFAVPMALATGWVVGELIDRTDWRVVLSRGGWAVILVTPVGLAALDQTISPWLAATGLLKPFSGHSLSQLNVTMQFVAASLVLFISLGALHWAWVQIGSVAFGRALTVLALGLLAVLTIRTAWAFAYINYDDAGEFLVYAHGSPDVRVVMEQVEEISQRTSGRRSLDIAYTGDGSYPFMWYLRNYPNASRLPNPPSRPDLDKSVIIAGDDEWGGIEPYLGDHYVCNHYNYMWWPMEDYDNLSWERIRYALVNSEMRGAIWDIMFRRDYRKYERVTGKTVRPSEWPLREGLRFCVRRDVLAKVWGESSGIAAFGSVVGEGSRDLSDYSGLEQIVAAELEIKALGPFGSLNNPHGMALDVANGFLYVADTDNHRVVKFSPEGDVINTWDSTWWRDRQTWQPNGCLDEVGRPLALGDGEFCEPWGVAVGPDGKVYVADTWNHRIQLFTSDGRFLNKIGSFGQSGSSVSSAPAQFYGPRDVAVDQLGYVYVSDTGNKRIQVFDADLHYQFAFGGPGIVEGRLDEPVGLAIGPDDLLYVADAWNKRVQVFTLRGDFVRQWPVVGWGSQSTFNKPYIAIDSVGRVYVSDPEGQRVVVFEAEGMPLVVLEGIGSSVLQLPVGVLLDAQDHLWVSDSLNRRLLRFSSPVFAQPE